MKRRRKIKGLTPSFVIFDEIHTWTNLEGVLRMAHRNEHGHNPCECNTNTCCCCVRRETTTYRHAEPSNRAMCMCAAPAYPHTVGDHFPTVPPRPAAPGWGSGGAEIFRWMTADVAGVNKMHGWYDTPRSFGDQMALLHSEVSEAVEAYRAHGLTASTGANGKPEGVGSEFADVLIRLLDNCHRYGVDLYAEYERKLQYNRGRPYRHGGKAL